MKILIVFIDMVRVDHLKVYNPQAKCCLLDKRLEEIGGTVFTRCYSPGPDTPRSMACMQTGLYPFFNGCDTRIKWPKYFVKDDVTTIWDHAVAQGMKINLCCNKNETITGFFKYSSSDRINEYYSLRDFVEKGDIGNNTISFIGTPDMHIAIGDYKATDYAFRKGDEQIELLFQKYITNSFISQFDYTIIFSDHGFQLEKENIHMKSSLELLDNGRNQLLMFIHKKNEKEFKTDSRLANMLDLYATVEQIIGGEETRQGYSLLETPQRTITHIEDHKDFLVYPEIMIKQWRVISDQFDIRTDVKETIITKGKQDDLRIVDEYLKENSPKYSDYVKQLEVWGYYDTLKSEESNQYFVGTNRASSFVLFPFKCFNKIKHLLHV